MTLVKFSPKRDNDRSVAPRTFSEFIDTFFDEALHTRRPMEGTFAPKMDIIETEGSYEVSVLLPGLKKEDIKIDLENRFLTVSGERKVTEDRQGVKYHLVEAYYGSFSRTITLPDNVNRENVNAIFLDGILKITIEKDEKAVTRNIEIK
ncbi:MAG: Hsp20/alpha crystallin family protein [Balneolales bacterium]|nr:Hsp20/alpha crystallin family protein [Balneolales bacterium]